MSTFAQIQDMILPSMPSQVVNLADDMAFLTVAEAQALISAGVRFADGDVVTILDSAAHLESLGAGGIRDLAAMGASSLVATDRAMDLDLSQIGAIAETDMTALSRYESVSPASPHDTRVNAPTAWQVGAQSVALLEDGTYVVTWSNRSTGSASWDVYAQRFGADGTKIDGEFVVNTDLKGVQTVPQVTTLPGGGFVVVWQGPDGQGDGIFAQQFDARGNRVGDETRVNTTTESSQWNPSVVALANGGYAITWMSFQPSEANWHLKSQVFGAGGAPLGGEVTVQTNLDNNPDSPFVTTALGNGNFAVVWAGGNFDIQARIVGPNGSVTGVIPVNAETVGVDHAPNITALSNGRFVVTWARQDRTTQIDIRSQLFDAAGNKIGPEQQANTYSDNAQTTPATTALADGGYVVTWVSWGQDGSFNGLYAQKFDGNGSPVGVETRVSQATSGYQIEQKVAALPDGGFAVTWSDAPSGGTQVICLQIVGRNGEKVGSLIRVSTESNLQKEPAISVLADGDILVTWLSGSGVLSRRFAHDTEKVSFKGTSDVVSALTSADAANFAELGVTSIKVGNGGAVTFTKDVTLLLSAVQGLTITGAASVTVTGSGTTLDDLSTGDVARLKSLGVTALDVTDGAIALTLAQADAYVGAGLAFAGNDIVTVRLAAGDLAGLTAGKIAALAEIGADVLDLTNDAATLSIAQAGLLRGAGLRFAAGDALTITDTAMHVAGLGNAEIAALGAWGVSVIDLTDGAFTLAVESAGRFLAAGIRFAASDAILVEDSAAAIEGLTAADIAAFAAAGIDGLRSLDGGVTLNAAQLVALGANGVSISAGGNVVKVSDTGARIAALNTSAIAYFQALGITTLDVVDDHVTLSLGQVNAFRSAGVQLDANDAITLSLAGSQAATLTGASIAALAGFGVDAIASAEAGLAFSAEQVSAFRQNGLTFATGYTATLSDRAAALLALTSADVAGLAGIGLDGIRLADGGQTIAGLSMADITMLGRLGVGAVDSTEGVVDLALSRAMIFAANGLAFDKADMVTITATAAALKDPDVIDIAAIKSINVDRIDASDNAMTLSLAQADAFVGEGIGFAAQDAITVKLSFSQAQAFGRASGDALHAAGVDRIEIDMTPQQVASLTYGQLKAFLAAGIDGISNVQLLDFGTFTYDLVTHQINYAPVISSNGGGTAAAINVAENTTAVTKVVATDTNPGTTLTYSIAGGADQALFAIDARTGVLSFKAAPDFETPKDAGKDNLYDVTVRVSDGRLIDTQAIRIKVTDIKGTSFTGTSGSDRMAGSPEHDLLDGRAGADIMSGGKGNDTYVVDNTGDRVVELANEGIDLVRASVSHALSSNVESLTLTGSGNLNGIGNTLANALTGNAGRNVLDGGLGNDILKGDAGNDQLIGGLGADQLFGGGGADVFVFKSVNETTVAASGMDTIFDFSRRDGDRIDLRAIDANIAAGGDQAFTFIGADVFHRKAGELRYEKKGGLSFVTGDINGDGTADFAIKFQGTIDFGKSDFVL